MPTAAEALAATDCADLRKQLETRDTCIANLNAMIGRLKALNDTYEREGDAAEATIIALRKALEAALQGNRELTF